MGTRVKKSLKRWKDIMNNVCMIAYSNLPSDVRIKREAEALIEKGYSVDIICLTGENESKYEKHNGVNIHRLNIGKKRGGMSSYLLEYNKFIIYSMVKLLKLNKKRKYSHVHVHNPPDTLVFAALPLKILQDVNIILDVHDPMPEIFASRFEKNMDSLLVRSIKALEYFCCRLSNKVITVNDTIVDNFQKKGINNVFVVMNSPDENLFTEEKRATSKEDLDVYGKFVVLYEGSIMKRRGLQILVDAINEIKTEIPNICCLIVGDGDYLATIQNKVDELKLEDHVRLLGRRPVEEMPEYIAVSDVCVIPFTDAPINNIGTPNKLFEYMIYEKPIIVPKLKAMSELLSEDECLFFEPGNSQDLAKCIHKVYSEPNEINKIIVSYKKVYKECEWNVMKQRLFDCYNGI